MKQIAEWYFDVGWMLAVVVGGFIGWRFYHKKLIIWVWTVTMAVVGILFLALKYG